ncbi:MAG: hypothetical protein WCX88_03430 [Patescibacteria group bacterium]
MSLIEQKTIEYFSKKHGINNQVTKVKHLSQITALVYDYNMAVVEYEREKDQYKKNQIKTDLDYIENKISKILK